MRWFLHPRQLISYTAVESKEIHTLQKHGQLIRRTSCFHARVEEVFVPVLKLQGRHGVVAYIVSGWQEEVENVGPLEKTMSL